METLIFYLFAALTLGCALLVVANPWSRNPVTSAMFLVLTLVCLAVLFVLLHAFFLAAVQVLIYAGAVMVLFLFVLMLLDVGDEQRRRWKRAGLAAGTVTAAALAAILWGLFRQELPGAELPGLEGDTRTVGRALFLDYLLPFEILSILLLSAMVGVILLSRKDLK